jgi:predicted HicB family RNase H-like nuclease
MRNHEKLDVTLNSFAAQLIQLVRYSQIQKESGEHLVKDVLESAGLHVDACSRHGQEPELE